MAPTSTSQNSKSTNGASNDCSTSIISGYRRTIAAAGRASTPPIWDSKSRASASRVGTSAHTASGSQNNRWDFANGLFVPNAKGESDTLPKFRSSLCAREVTCKTFLGENGYTRASNPRASGHFASSQLAAQHSAHKK